MQMNRKDGKETMDFVQNNGNCPLTLVLFHGLEYPEMRNRSNFSCFAAVHQVPNAAEFCGRLRPQRRRGVTGFMSEEKKVRHSRDRDRRENHDNDVELRPLEKDGEKLLSSLEGGKIVAVQSGLEIMYVLVIRHNFQCFIHKMDAEDGRQKAFPVNERNRAMFKNLASLADGLFEITPKDHMNPMGAMVAAERGIIAYLDATGQLPAEDQDFMSWQEATGEDHTEGG